MKSFFVIATLALVFVNIVSGFWQEYVDSHLIGGGSIQQAAIIGHDGQVRAISSGFMLKPGEANAIVDLFKNPGKVFATGVTVAGVKYVGIKGDDQSIYGKRGATGVVCVKTKETIIIGVYDERTQPGNAANAVEKLGDYLRDISN